jgi:surface polysaccharide O-acyltransferase-like enzyme
MSQKELFSINQVRVFATFMVVLLHVAAPVRDQWHNMATANFIVGAIFDSFGRCGVPLFLMISGALLLGQEDDPLTFYKKRFSRIIFPFLFWGLLYAFFSAWQNNQPVHIEKILSNLLWGPSYYHLWYLYMLMGIYLVAPFVQILVRHLSKKHFELLLFLWSIFSVLLPQISGQLKIWLNYDFSIGIHYHFPDLYLGYFLLGHYLFSYHNEIKLKRAGLWFVAITIFQAAISILIYWKTTTYQELMIMPYSPTVVIQAALLFYWIQNWRYNTFTSRIGFISVLSFGVYLLHPLVIELFKIGTCGVTLSAKSADTIIAIPLTFIVVLSLSLVVIRLGQKIPLLNRFIS